MEGNDDEVACFEEIEVGLRFRGSETYALTRDEIVEFARKWDSRDYHVDDEAARRSIFGGLVASGAHVIAIWTKLSLAARRESRPWATLAGLGSEIEMRNPTRPGDELRYEGEVIEKRDSAKRPGAGVVRTRHRLLNQRGDAVFESVSAVLVRRRERGPGV